VSAGKVDVLAVMAASSAVLRLRSEPFDALRNDEARAAVAFASSSLKTIREEARHHGHSDIAQLADDALARIGGAP